MSCPHLFSLFAQHDVVVLVDKHGCEVNRSSDLVDVVEVYVGLLKVLKLILNVTEVVVIFICREIEVLKFHPVAIKTLAYCVLFPLSFVRVLLYIEAWIQVDHLSFVADAAIASGVNGIKADLAHVIEAVEAVKRCQPTRALSAVDLDHSACTLLFKHLALENRSLNYQERLPKQFNLEIPI